MDVLEELQQATADVAARRGRRSWACGFGWRPGSGVVIGPDRVLTCAHSVRGDDVTARLPTAAAPRGGRRHSTPPATWP